MNPEFRSIDEWCEIISGWAKEKGWDDKERAFDEWIALFHTEISEAYEEYRNGRSFRIIYYKEGKPEGIPIELVDCVIRLMHFFGKYGISMEECLSIKMEYNKKRPYRHGNKVSCNS